jgi:DNA ligase-4
MLTSLSADEQKWLIRMLLKDMKFGLGQKFIFSVYHQDALELYDVSNNLLKVHNIFYGRMLYKSTFVDTYQFV